MKIPFRWLNEFVDIPVGPSELAERLTFAGLEVEGLDVIGSDYPGIVVGEVLSRDPHPNADHLTVCRVNSGMESLQVVCGAPNVEIGMKTPFAAAGATLPNGMKIKAAKLRGIESRGMLCAEDELGLSDDHTGLMVLPRDVAPGTPLSVVMGPPETVLTIEVTPNRPDCLCVMGVARETAALYDRRLKTPSLNLKECGAAVDTLTSVVVEDPDGCPRYTARILSDVTIGPSPLWMRRRLTLCGIRPINTIVDITNYVMLECGQPLHAFDQSLLHGGRIVVRRAKPGERMPTLDATERELSPDLLVIADAVKPVAVAGVMGGATSGILPTTRTVLLESACFKPTLIRRCSKILGLATESSYRFERGVDIQQAEWASRRAACLMTELANASAARGVIDVHGGLPEEKKIRCRFDRAKKLLGIDIADDRMCGIFESLHLKVIDRDKQACTAQIPTFRPDLELEADLIEEIARIHGLDKIPSPAPQARLVPNADDTPARARICCRAGLIGLGLFEIVNYSFVAERLLDLFDAGTQTHRIYLPRPLSADHAILRNSLIPQMVETLGRNRSRQIVEAAMFETGRVFFKADRDPFAEEERLAIGLMGPIGRTGLTKRQALSAEDVFLWLKGILEQLCRTQHVSLTLGTDPFPPPCFSAACFEPDQAACIRINDRPCGIIGLIRSAIRDEWRLTDPVAVLEVQLDPLLAHLFDTPAMESLPAYPSVVRDLAIIVDQRIRHEDILRAIQKIALKELTTIEPFDIYQGKAIGVGKKSMAYSLTYRSMNRTLTDEEVNQFHTSIMEGIKNELKAEIRVG